MSVEGRNMDVLGRFPREETEGKQVYRDGRHLTKIISHYGHNHTSSLSHNSVKSLRFGVIYTS